MRRPPTSATTISLSITPISCRCTCDPSVMGHHFLAVRVSVNNVTTSVGWSAYWIHLFVMARIGNCVSRVLTYIVQFHYSFVSFSPFTDSDISELESGDSSLDTAGKFIFTINLFASFCNVYFCLRFQNNQNSHWCQEMEMSLMTKLWAVTFLWALPKSIFYNYTVG